MPQSLLPVVLPALVLAALLAAWVAASRRRPVPVLVPARGAAVRGSRGAVRR